MPARVVCLLLAACAALATPVARADAPLQTAVVGVEYGAGEGNLAFSRVAAAGATAVAITFSWAAIAPTEPVDPTDPADPAYHWAGVDSQVELAAANGLSVIAELTTPPSWALEPAGAGAPATVPDPAALGAFAQAAATRYGGSPDGLPAIRDWSVWNEPNISLFFQPQFVGDSPYSPGWYRDAVNDAAAAVKSVSASNLVIAGNTAPFYDNTPSVTAIDSDWGPLSFMRDLLCLGPDLQPTCDDPVHFDIWATHPYTDGDPWRSATLPNDVELGDLPEMRAVLEAATAAGNLVSAAPVRFWVTEFSWDSDPPDPLGVPDPLLTRWTAEALYTMWQSGVSLVTWFTLRDLPYPSSPYQAGLYYRGATLAQDTPKPLLQAFTFPFVAYAHRSEIEIWGRTPCSCETDVTIEQSATPGWSTIGTVESDDDGIFVARLDSAPAGSVRAEILPAGPVSAAFSLVRPPDQTFNPFGGPPLEPPPSTARPTLPHVGPVSSARRIQLELALRTGG